MPDESKQAEDALRKNEERFRTLFENMPTGAALCQMVLDEAGQPVDFLYSAVNSAFGRLTGLENVVGKRASEILPGIHEVQPDFLEIYGRVARTGQPERFENEVKSLGLWLTIAVYCPEPGHFAAIFDDITERRRAEEALRESEAVLSSFFDSAGVLRGIQEIINGQVFHVSCNAAVAALLGVDRESIPGKRVTDLGASEEVERTWIDLYETSRRTGQPFSLEYARKAANGQEYWLLTTGNYLGPGRSGHPRFGYTVVDVTERKKAEEAAKLNSALFGKLIEQAPGGVYVVDAQLRIQHINAVALPTFATAQPVIGRDLGEVMEVLWGPELGRECTRMFRNTLETGEQYVSPRFDRLRQDIDEQQVYEWQTQRVTLPDGHDGVVCYFQDVTVSERVAEALRASEMLYRGIGESIDYGVWVCAPDGRNTYTSESFLRLVGMTQAQCSDFGWGDVLHPDDAAGTIAAWQECVRTGVRWNREHRIRGADGQWHHVLARGVPVKNERGEIFCWAGINLDISQLKETEEALRNKRERLLLALEAQEKTQEELRANEQRMRLATEATHVGIWEWNVITNALRWDAEMFRIYGIAPTAGGFVDYTDWSHAIVPEELAENEAIIHDTIRRRGQSKRNFCIRRRKDGECRHIESVETVRMNEHGEVEYMVGTNLDITERKRIEAELRNVDRRKDEFLATLAHELRNPLAPMRNALHILHVKGSAAPQRQWATEVIDRQVRAMSRLIDDLMDLSRINQGRVDLKREHVELAKVVQGAVETSRPLIEEMGHELTVTLPPHPVIVDADLTRLAQVLLNLLNNAAKYTERGGRIDLRVELAGRDVVVSVTDTGIGIPADQLRTIFEMFSQVEGALSRSRGGLGIGLSLVKRLVELHGGSIEARSRGIGQGSEFVVRLPIVVQATSPSEVSEAADKVQPPPNLRVLVVDDNEDAAESLGMLLEIMGNTVHTAYDGEEAVAAAEAFRPHVVVCDIGLPKLNGYEVARALRERPWGKDMCLIALTGWGQESDKRRALEASFDHHLTKPVDPERIEALIAGFRPRSSV